MNNQVQKVAKILGANPEELEKILNLMEKLTSKKGILARILLENEAQIKRVLQALKITSHHADQVGKGLQDELYQDDQVLFELLGKPQLRDPIHATLLIEKGYEAIGTHSEGFFLKKEKAREMLLQTPPMEIMRVLGYRDVKELLEKERLEEVFAALRFIESRQWMNEVFIQQYKRLTPDDFETHPIEAFVLQEKWLSLAQTFAEKKYHNVSHLKELGVIFIIPIPLDTPGETLRMFCLYLHYLYEVPFYSKLISTYATTKENFSSRLVSLIRGDVKGERSEFSDSAARWLIVQRYLAKDDKNDPRLFIPHVNPEAIHWKKAQKSLTSFANKFSELSLSLFADLDYVGDFFISEGGGEELVSFDLVDNVMTLVKRNSSSHKYLYHHQEALWNRIFAGFIGEEKMEQSVLENLDKGYIELTE